MPLNEKNRQSFRISASKTNETQNGASKILGGEWTAPHFFRISQGCASLKEA
jgi:hypothetical protein